MHETGLIAFAGVLRICRYIFNALSSGTELTFLIEPDMDRYNNRRSGVKGYSFGDTYITVYFKSGGIYTYTFSSCSELDILNMKILAVENIGLNTYINQHKPGYASKYNPNERSRDAFPV